MRTTLLKELQTAIGYLPTYKRVALFMVVLEGRAHAEVAEMTGCTVGTAKTRVF